MAFTLEQMEYLHDTGKMSDWIYYQQNGKTAQKNYAIQKQKQHLAKEKKKLEAEIEEKAEKFIEKALEELLKDFAK